MDDWGKPPKSSVRIVGGSAGIRKNHVSNLSQNLQAWVNFHLFAHFTQYTIKYLLFNPLIKSGNYPYHLLQHPKLDKFSPYGVNTYVIRMILTMNIGTALYYTNRVHTLYIHTVKDVLYIPTPTHVHTYRSIYIYIILNGR